MTIAYVGNRKNLGSDGLSFNTENHIAKTLEKLGHTVRFIQEDEIEPGTLCETVADADLFLWTRTWQGAQARVFMEDLQAIEALGIPTASFHLDKYAGIQRDGGIGVDVFWKTQHVFSPEGSPESEAIFKSHNINHHYLKPGVFEDECYIAEPSAKFPHEIVFVGGGAATGRGPQYGHVEWPYRGQLIKFLEDTYGDRFYKWGWPNETIRGKELNELYASAKIVVGDSLCKDFKDSYYWSDRTYETMGRGGFLIHPYIKGLDEEFIDGATISFYKYGQFAQLKERIDYFLAHDAEREKIRKAGHEFVKKNATYTQRLTQMLDTIFPPQQYDITPAAVGDYIKGQSIKISLGAGTEPEEGFVNVDIVPLEGIDVVCNLMQYPWPFNDEQATYIKAKDIIEHMATHLSDGRSSIIAFIEECHRILQTGGTLWIQTPAWDAPFLWIDPTHVRGYALESFDFFDPETDFGRATGFYSECTFKVTATRLENGNLQFEMIKR